MLNPVEYRLKKGNRENSKKSEHAQAFVSSPPTMSFSAWCEGIFSGN
jgi:hypothetical protein